MALSPSRRSRAPLQRLTAKHRARGLLFADQPQAPRAAGEHVAGQLFEVARGRLEGLLEGLLDLAIGVADDRAQLAQSRLQVGATPLHLLDVLDRLGVLLLRERVDRPELFAPAGQPLDARAQRGDLLFAPARSGVGAGRRLRPRLARLGQAQALGDRLELELGLARLVAQSLCGDLGAP